MKLVKYTRPSPIDELFGDLSRGLFPALRAFGDTVAEVENETARLPRTNVRENDGAFVFTMEMPGVTRKDVEVSIENDTLTIRGGKTEEVDTSGLLRREIRSSKFERAFTLSTGIDRDKIAAKMVDGVLTVTLPKTADRLGRKIDVA